MSLQLGQTVVLPEDSRVRKGATGLVTRLGCSHPKCINTDCVEVQTEGRWGGVVTVNYEASDLGGQP